MAGPAYSHGDLEALWKAAGGDPLQANTAAAIARAESGGCQYAQRGPSDIRPVKACVYVHDPLRWVIGLWQINQSAHPTYTRSGLFGAAYNALAAVAISDKGRNWNPWTTYTSGAYKDLLLGVPAPPPPPPSSTAGAQAATSHRGWADLRNSVNRHLPANLSRTQGVTASAQRILAHRHKIRG